eukprot:1193972-Prorocentrum_minimum.AAC.4
MDLVMQSLSLSLLGSGKRWAVLGGEVTCARESLREWAGSVDTTNVACPLLANCSGKTPGPQALWSVLYWGPRTDEPKDC